MCVFQGPPKGRCFEGNPKGSHVWGGLFLSLDPEKVSSKRSFCLQKKSPKNKTGTSSKTQSHAVRRGSKKRPKTKFLRSGLQNSSGPLLDECHTSAEPLSQWIGNLFKRCGSISPGIQFSPPVFPLSCFQHGNPQANISLPKTFAGLSDQTAFALNLRKVLHRLLRAWHNPVGVVSNRNAHRFPFGSPKRVPSNIRDEPQI